MTIICCKHKTDNCRKRIDNDRYLSYNGNMDINKATELEVFAGSSIEDVVNQLLSAKKQGQNVFANFNGNKLFSADVTMDSAYLTCTGKTKAEFDQLRKEWRENYEKKEKEERKQMEGEKPKLYARGHAIISPELHEDWIKCVDVRVADLYRGNDLLNALAIMEALASGQSVQSAFKLFEEAGHSGMSASVTTSVTTSVIKHFSPRGQEFADLVYPTKETDKKLSKQKLTEDGDETAPPPKPAPTPAP